MAPSGATKQQKKERNPGTLGCNQTTKEEISAPSGANQPTQSTEERIPHLGWEKGAKHQQQKTQQEERIPHLGWEEGAKHQQQKVQQEEFPT